MLWEKYILLKIYYDKHKHMEGGNQRETIDKIWYLFDFFAYFFFNFFLQYYNVILTWY